MCNYKVGIRFVTSLHGPIFHLGQGPLPHLIDTASLVSGLQNISDNVSLVIKFMHATVHDLMLERQLREHYKILYIYIAKQRSIASYIAIRTAISNLTHGGHL